MLVGAGNQSHQPLLKFLQLLLVQYCIVNSTSFAAEMLSLALALPALVTAYVAYAPAEGSGAFVNGALQNILKNTDKTDKYKYPTDFTRGIEPVSI